jgi:hypothetical protein
VTPATSVHVVAGVNVPEPFDEKVIFPVGLPSASGPVTFAVTVTAFPTCVLEEESPTVVVVPSRALSVTLRSCRPTLRRSSNSAKFSRSPSRPASFAGPLAGIGVYVLLNL